MESGVRPNRSVLHGRSHREHLAAIEKAIRLNILLQVALFGLFKQEMPFGVAKHVLISIFSALIYREITTRSISFIANLFRFLGSLPSSQIIA